LAPGTLLLGRYEVLGLVARQAGHAAYHARDRLRCPACGAEREAAGEACPACGAGSLSPAACLLHEWSTPPEPEEGAASFEMDGCAFTVERGEPAPEEAFPHGVRLDVGVRCAGAHGQPAGQGSTLALTLSPAYGGRPAPALGLLAVADGVGEKGSAAGRVAVQALAQEVVARVLLAELGGEICLAETLTAILAESVEAANTQVIQTGGGSGSTLAAALVRDRLAVVVNVGDSRVYHRRGGTLRQVTRDHSIVAQLVAAGQIAPEEAHGHPQKGVLYRSLGDRPTVKADTFSLRLAPDDWLILCCANVWSALGAEGLEAVLCQEETPQAVCDEAARRTLEKSDASIVTVHVVSPRGLI
jgi:serine/threonine protein phosphatase PrpC